MHKHTRKKLPTSLSTFFAPVKAIHTRSTRLASSELNLYLPRYKSQKLQKSFKYQGVKIWNSVPQDLKQLPFNPFKTKYKKHLFSKYKWIFQAPKRNYWSQYIIVVDKVFQS